jgi:hypothetical protein
VSWRDEASCITKPSAWWLNVTSYDIGKRVCLECPVRAECLSDQLVYESSVGMVMPGVYGGTTERDRSRQRRGPYREPMHLELSANGHQSRHGGQTAYIRGCRCETCVEAQRARWRRAKAIAG